LIHTRPYVFERFETEVFNQDNMNEKH